LFNNFFIRFHAGAMPPVGGAEAPASPSLAPLMVICVVLLPLLPLIVPLLPLIVPPLLAAFVWQRFCCKRQNNDARK